MALVMVVATTVDAYALPHQAMRPQGSLCTGRCAALSMRRRPAQSVAVERRCASPLMQQRPVEKLAIELGPEGEPKGTASISLRPLLPNSEFVTLDLGLPLGMIIEVVDDGSGSVAGQWYQKTRVVVTDALPGYSSYGNVQKGDLLRALTAYRTVLVAPDGFSAWKQMTSYTPVGEPELRRLVFKTEGASYDDIRDAIQSHREGNMIATLIIERSLDSPEEGESESPSAVADAATESGDT